MVPLPYDKLIALLESKKESTKEKNKQPEKTARFARSLPLAPQRSNGVRKTSPSPKKDTPREKPTAPLNLVNTLMKDAEHLAAKPETSPPGSLAQAESNGIRKHSPLLKKDPPQESPKVLLESEKKPSTESEKSIAKPSTPPQASLAPPPSTENGENSSSREENHHFEKLRRPEKRLKTEAKCLPENTMCSYERNPVPQKGTSTRRSLWPQICKGKGPRGLCR